MKIKLLLLLALAASAVQAAMPIEKTITHASTPFNWGHDEYHYIFPKEYGVHGLRLNTFYVMNRYMFGLDLGFWNASEDAGGIQIALYRNQSHQFGGAQFSFWNAETKRTSGLQAAIVSTDAEDVYGVQLTGCLGRAREVDGIQLAILSAVAESETDEGRTSGLQAGIFEARSENLDGVQLGGVFSDAFWEANGVQLAVLFSEARYLRGLQGGILTARADESSGVQIAGLLARSEIKSKGLLQLGGALAQCGDLDGGLQFSFLAANAVGRVDGVQIAGMGTSAGSLHGVGIGGLWNYAFEDMHGLQLALVHNHARYVHGVQIGLINHCERLGGVQIGLINAVEESQVEYIPFVRGAF